MKKSDKVTFVVGKLEELYPEVPVPLDHYNPYTLLIAVLLSAQCTDERVNLVTEDLFKKPGVAETIDWAKCLLALDVVNLSPEVIADTLGAILKYQDDIQKLQGSEAKRILDEAKATLEPA